MSDEGFHEIQLNGKQLVFLFMAATVVSVVIFLCGVMVGRGVPAGLGSGAAELSAESGLDPTVSADAPVATSSAASVAQGTPLSAQETLTYAERLEAPNAAPETLRAPRERVDEARPIPRDVAPPVVAEPVPARAEPAPAETARVDSARAAAARTESTASAEPAGNGFVVQVASIKERREADAMARRLAAKGYPSFVTTVTTPGAATPTGFRVRIGKYDDRREAETISRKLQQEEQFKPWITR
jgi:cell division septation protein DedD